MFSSDIISSIVMIVLFLLVLFIFYKRNFFIKMISGNVTSSTNRFQEQLEQTGDLVIKRLEEQIVHLEYLLEEANEKMISLDLKIQTANKFLNNEHNEDVYLVNEEIKDTVDAIEYEKKTVTDWNIDLYRDMPRQDKRSVIIEMTDLGYDITEIAKATGISKGEIMLLLQLNKK